MLYSPASLQGREEDPGVTYKVSIIPGNSGPSGMNSGSHVRHLSWGESSVSLPWVGAG